jgi:hypothetical protein
MRQGRVVETRHSGHLFYYSAKSLHKLLERAGLKILSLKNFHFKTALKAHGWTPGAYKQFDEPHPHQQGPQEILSLAQYKALIPAKPSWPLYYANYKMRRLWRWPNVEWGYDFEVLAEK